MAEAPSPDETAATARLWSLVGTGIGSFAALTLVLGGVTMLAVRGALLTSFRDIGAVLPGLSELVLGGWYAVAWGLPQLALLGVALAVNGPLRAILAGCSLLLGVAGLGAFVVGAWLPFFTLASSF